MGKQKIYSRTENYLSPQDFIDETTGYCDLDKLIGLLTTQKEKGVNLVEIEDTYILPIIHREETDAEMDKRVKDELARKIRRVKYHEAELNKAKKELGLTSWDAKI